MTERKCIVTLRHKETGEQVDLVVWSRTGYQLRAKLREVLTGEAGEYKRIKIELARDEAGQSIKRKLVYLPNPDSEKEA